MKSSAPILACALAAALVVPSLLAALPVCAMPDCGPEMSAMPVVSAAGHDCCPQATTEIAADCCPPSLASPAAPPKLPEHASGTTIMTAVVAAQPPSAPVAGSGAAAAPPQLQLDSLAQGCILRI